jgi:hypothetical protein
LLHNDRSNICQLSLQLSQHCFQTLFSAQKDTQSHLKFILSTIISSKGISTNGEEITFSLFRASNVLYVSFQLARHMMMEKEKLHWKTFINALSVARKRKRTEKTSPSCLFYNIVQSELTSGDSCS